MTRSLATLAKGTALIIAGALALTACAGGGSADDSNSAKDSVVVAVAAFPEQRAAEGQFDQEFFHVLTNTNATLIRNPYVTSVEDPNALVQDLYNWEGVLAESYDISEDGKTVTFHLRTGVVSQAGNPFTADDVLWSFERKWNAETSHAAGASRPALYDPASQVKKVDDHTITITVDEPGHVAPLMAVLTKYLYYIYDSTLLQEHATPNDPYAVEWSSDNGNYGYGAYEIVSMRDGEEYVLEANPDYPLEQPQIKRVTYRVVPDAATRALMLRNGDVAAAEGLEPSDLVDLASDKNVQTFEPETNETLFAYLNTLDDVFGDVAVREAFAYAVPYQEIIDRVYKGRATPVQGWLDPNLPGRDTSGIPDLEYNPEKAKEILEDAGITTPVPARILIAEGFADLDGAAIQIQSAAKDAGFDLTIETLTTTAESERRMNRDFEVRLEHGMVISRESVPYTLTIFTDPDDPLSGWPGWAPPEYGQLITKGMEAGDALSPEAMTYWHEAEVMFTNAYPAIQIASLKSGFAMSSKLTGWADRSDPSTDWSTISFAD